MGGSVQLDGLVELRRSLDAAADALAHMDPTAAAVGQLVVQAARPNAPRRTGRLAAGTLSDVVDGEPIVYSDQPYGPPIHWGWPSRHIVAHPFIWDAWLAQVDRVLATYAADAQTILDNVKGT